MHDIVCVLLEFALWDSHLELIAAIFSLYIIKHDGVLMLFGFFCAVWV